ncbi:hypothetical protein GN156_10705 [bacterium LRH843]|nr:hypothetical protein [bacterium LRH843]
MEGQDVTNFTLLERKMMLDHIIPEDIDVMAKVKYTGGLGDVLFDLVKEQGLEGIVQKSKHSKYFLGVRSPEWY